MNFRQFTKMLWVLVMLVALLSGGLKAHPLSAAPLPQTTDSAEEARCHGLMDLLGLTVYDAKLVTSDAETYCKVQGLTGQIHWVVKLPLADQWNGRFLMNGDGGHDGDIDLNQAPDTNTDGFAIANSDMGHSAVTEPGSTFAYNNRQAEIDYGYRSIDVTARAAKHLIEQYYGRPADYSYFAGCSTGGREAGVIAQRFPNHFDGVVGGSLFNQAIEIAMEQAWSSALFMRDVDGDGQGYDNLITPEDIDALHEAVLAKCDVLGNDKIQDGFVDNPLACAAVFGDGDVDAVGAERGWTEGQIQAVKEVYRGPHDSSGENQWHKGKPLGSELTWKFWVVPTPLNNMAPWQTGFAATFVNHLWFEHDPGLPTANPVDPVLLPGEGEYRWLDFDFDRNTPTGASQNPGAGPWTADDGGAFMRKILNGSATNLKPFLVDGGAKYLLYHGWGDGLIGGEPTVDYFEGVVRDTFDGDSAAAQENVRLFMVSGMGHCQDDFGAGSASEWDKLAPIVEWVENGTAPDSIVVRHTSQDGQVDNERIICPWPLQPTYVGPDGGAEPDSANWVAANFECQSPAE